MPTQWWQFAPSDRLHVSSLHNTQPLHTSTNRSTSTRRNNNNNNNNYSTTYTPQTYDGRNGGSSLVRFTQPQTSASSSSVTGITASPSFTRSRTYHAHIAHTPLGENYHVKTSLPLNPHDGLVYMEVQIVGIADHTLTALQEKLYRSDNNINVIMADEIKSILEPSLVIGICRELLPTHSLPGQDATSVGLYTKQKMIFSNSHKTTERVALPLCGIPPLLLESSVQQEKHEEENLNDNSNKQKDENIIMSSEFQAARGNSSPTNGLGAIRSCSLQNQQRAMVGNNNENRLHHSVHWAESTQMSSIRNNNSNNHSSKKNRRGNNVHGTTRRKLTIGDVIGCLANFFDNTLHFTLNGELLEYSRKLDEKISLSGYYMAIGMQAGCPSMTFQVIFRTGNRSLCNVNQSLFHLHSLPPMECLLTSQDKTKWTKEEKLLKKNSSSTCNSNSTSYHVDKQKREKYCYKTHNSDDKCNENDNGTNDNIIFDLNSYVNAVAMKMIRHSAQLQEEQKKLVQLKEHKQMIDKLEEATIKRDNKRGMYNQQGTKNTRDYLIIPDENQMEENDSPYDTNDVFKYKSNSTEFKENLNFLEYKQELVEEMETHVEDKSVNDRAMVSLLAQFMSIRGMTHSLRVLQEEVNELHYGQTKESQNKEKTSHSGTNSEETTNKLNKSIITKEKEVVKSIALECALCHSETIAQARHVLFAHTPIHMSSTSIIIKEKENNNHNKLKTEYNNPLSMWRSHSVVSPVVWQSVLHLLFPFNSRICLCNCHKTKEEVEWEEEWEEQNKKENKEYAVLSQGHVMQRIAHLSSLLFFIRRQDILFMLQSLHLIESCCATLLREITSIRNKYVAKDNCTEITTIDSLTEDNFMSSSNCVNVLHSFAITVLQPFRALSAAKEMLNAEQELCVMPFFSQDHILREMCNIVESMCVPRNEQCDQEMNKVNSRKLFCAKSTTSSYSTSTLSHAMQTLNVNEAPEQLKSLMQQMKVLRSSAIERIKQEHAVKATRAEQIRIAVQNQLEAGNINNNNNSNSVASKKNAKATSSRSSYSGQNKLISPTTTTTTPVKHNINVPHTPQPKEKYKLLQQLRNEEEQYKQEQQEILDQVVAIVMAECTPIIDPPALPEQIYIAQTLNTFCMRVRSFFHCFQVPIRNSKFEQDKENNNSSIVILEWCERWMTLIQTALVQYRERVWVILHKAIEDANESACQNIFFCILRKLQVENRKLSLYNLFENFTDSDDYYIKNFTTANCRGSGGANEHNDYYYYSHVINIFDNYISKDTSRKHRESELLREFTRALMQRTNGSSLRSIWRTCHVKSIPQSAPQMPSNAFLNEMSAILHDLPPFFITKTLITQKEKGENEPDSTFENVKTDYSINKNSKVTQLNPSRSPLKRPATPPMCEEHTKAQRHLFHLHTRNKATYDAHPEEHWSNNSLNEHRLQLGSSGGNIKNNTNIIHENKCKSNNAALGKQVESCSQGVFEEEWHMDEFSLGAVYLHRIYKRLFQ